MVRLNYTKVKSSTFRWREMFGSWQKPLDKLLKSVYMQKLIYFIHKNYSNKECYPRQGNIFKAFRLCEWDNLKVVILGQDPYHDGKATGLAFANFDSIEKVCIRPSASLKEIEKSLNSSIENFTALDYTLEEWAKQGVLLLNTALTVEKGLPKSHSKYWKLFTREVIKAISENNENIIFMLWGSEAKVYMQYIDREKHHVLTDVHPAFAVRLKDDWNTKNFLEANVIISEKRGLDDCIKW